MKTLIYALIALLFVSSLSFAGTINPAMSDEKHIQYGEKFVNVVRITVVDHKNTKMLGSAVVLNKHWIITAAHVIQNAKSCIITLKDKEYCLDFVVRPKEFAEEDIGKKDIALGYCKDSFDIEFDMELYQDNNEVGKICSMAGFGISGTFNTGAIISDNKKRGGSNKIKETFRDLLICSVSDPNPTSLEFLIASGDSGGGLFIDGKLAGIHSCVLADDKDGPNSDYGDESGHTRISEHLEWIRETIEKKEVTSNLEPSE